MAENNELTPTAENGNQTPATSIAQMDQSNLNGRSDWGNKLVVNTGTKPVINFAFMLRVEGVFDLPCKSVKGIRRENEFDYIQEGGLNDYVHLKRKAISKPFTFQVERYVGVDWIDPMPLGTELVLPLILFVNSRTFPELRPVRNYVFTGCTVISKDYGELNAEASGLLVETVTIAYREMVCVDIPSATYEHENVWSFDGKKKEGKGDRKYNKNLFNKEWEEQYASKALMQERANLWPNEDSAKKHPKHVSLEQAEKEAEKNRWKPSTDQNGKPENKFGKNYEDYVEDYNKKIDEEIIKAETEEEKKAAQAKKLAMGGRVARKYEHSAQAKQISSAKFLKEKSKLQMEAESKLWPETESAKRQKMETPEARTYSHGEKPVESGSVKHLEENTRKQMEAESKLWPETESAKRQKMETPEARIYGHGINPAESGSVTHLAEMSKAQMEEKSRLWPRTSSARQITDFLKRN